jgi:hypothetical protein
VRVVAVIQAFGPVVGVTLGVLDRIIHIVMRPAEMKTS